MPVPRVPLSEEAIEGAAKVGRYDLYAARFMLPEYRRTVNIVRRSGIKVGRGLDVGSGSGRLAAQLAKMKNRQFDIVGLDISGGMLKEARANACAGLAGQVCFVQATAASLPFPDETFDIVMSYASLHHWQQPLQILNEIWRVTKNNGFIVIRDNRRMLDNPFYRFCVFVLSLFMSKSEKGRWPKSILASYTVPEIEEILGRSNLHHYKVKPDMLGFDLCIELVKKVK